jgi:hypothetical protein
MKVPKVIPKPAEIGHEALLIIGGTVLAALIIGFMPGVRDWIRQRWDGAPKT